MTRSLLPDPVVARLRDCLRDAGYTVDGVRERLGTAAHAALGRNETTPAYRVTGSGDALDTLIRLFLLQREVPETLLDKALPGLTPDLAGVLVAEGNEIRAAIDIRPYQDWWVAADLTRGWTDGGRRCGRTTCSGWRRPVSALST